ncbi:hypothetical protein C8J57DRAFT_1281453 [Mycena rebaudengoi]|nr:hypothetical protein C8J57DRAFT_1281453 [Mycena rebaudengoi]
MSFTTPLLTVITLVDILSPATQVVRIDPSFLRVFQLRAPYISPTHFFFYQPINTAANLPGSAGGRCRSRIRSEWMAPAHRYLRLFVTVRLDRCNDTVLCPTHSLK